MNGSDTRRGFLGAFLGSTAVAALPSLAAAPLKPAPVKLGVCSYSFTAKMRLPEVIHAVQALAIRPINIKPEFHLPYASSALEITEARRMMEDAGLLLAGTGTTYMTRLDEGEIRRRFEFNKALGSPLIVIGPTLETLPLIERFVKEYDIKVAIHNHGPSDLHFPTPQSALRAIQPLDPRVGLCMDVGHTMRSGVDPVAAAQEAGPRLLDLHAKDVRRDSSGNWPAVNVGDGIIAIPALFRQLEKMGFAGYCNLEHELRGEDKLPDMRISFAYMRGVLASLG
jgi:sugar phosphate isomerase/epimerase